MSKNITALWDEVKVLVEQVELDVKKNAKGNASAGVRVRKGLRLMKSWISELVRESLELEKARKANKTDSVEDETEE
jgi:hypothetical protein